MKSKIYFFNFKKGYILNASVLLFQFNDALIK